MLNYERKPSIIPVIYQHLCDNMNYGSFYILKELLKPY